MAEPHTPRWPRSTICAHRGASAQYPENTRAAFDAARQLGAGWIETDLQLLADGELVVFHDDHLGRTAAGDARVASLTWPEMATLDIGTWKDANFFAERPMRLDDLLAWQADSPHSPGMVWEMKCPEPADRAVSQAAAQAVAAKLCGADPARHVLSSFDRGFLECVGPLLPDLERALIVEAVPSDALAFSAAHGLAALHLDGHQLTEQQATELMGAGLRLRCYTINDVALAKRLVGLGVDTIMTDCPDLFLAPDRG